MERLDERNCLEDSAYSTTAYREAMAQGLTVDSFFGHADPTQLQNLTALWPYSVRGKVVADVGCGGGSFLDGIAGVASRIIAIEPSRELYGDSLVARGYEYYQYIEDAISGNKESVDFVFSFQVVEHVSNPKNFLSSISKMMAPGALLFLSTPNRMDILNNLLEKDFKKFFYRSVHRWYFDYESISTLLLLSGFKIEEIKFNHGFGLSNTLAWLRDKKPTGHDRMDSIQPLADLQWKAYLESSGQSDTLYALARKI